MLADKLTLKVSRPVVRGAYSETTGNVVSGNTLGVQMVTKADHTALIALSLVLERQPTNQDSIRPLVKSGVLTFDLQLNKSGLADGFYARQAAYNIYWTKGTIITELAHSESQGAEARTAFSIQLTQEQSLDALSMLQYQPSMFSVNVDVTFLENGITEVVTMKGMWGDISKFLSENCDEEGLISKPVLRELFPAMQKLNLISTTNANNEPIALSLPQFEKMFMRQAGVVLKQTFEEGSSDVSYQLRTVTYAGFELNYSEKIALSSEKTLKTEATLDQLLKNIPVKAEMDKCVFLVTQQGSGSLQTVPVKANISCRATSRNIVDGRQDKQLAMMNGRLSSVALATRPVTESMQFSKPDAAEISNTSVMNYVSIDLDTKTQPRSMPVVTDANAPFFNDRISDIKAWYTPKIVVVNPDMNAEPDTSPFLFRYEAAGATSAGEPALKGTLHVTFKFTLAPELQDVAAAAGRTELLPVSMERLTVNLLIPFNDELDGKTKQHTFPANVTTENDTVTADVEFSNDWVRLAYGSLSTANFQSINAQVQVFYVFSCYNIVQTTNYQVIFGAKSLATKVFYPTKMVSRSDEILKLQNYNGGYIDAEKLTYEHPLSSLQFKCELPDTKKASKDTLSATSFIYARPVQPVVTTTVKPVAYLNPAIWATITPVQYSSSVQTISATVPLLFPCNSLGNFYQQIIEGEPQSIGCQDAFKLGEIKYKEYEEIAELRDEQYQVYRALPQPGRFVIVPVRFCITRREVGEEDAYRPLIFLNALLDPATPANNKVELRVTMQPDIPVFKIKQVAEKLKGYHPAPTIEYSVEVQNKSTDVAWAMDPAITATSESDLSDASGPFVSVYFSTNLAGWQLLKSVLTSPGLNGSIAVNLADGSRFSSNLLIKLDTVRGTWLNGPLELLPANGQITLTNKTKGKINVSDLVKYDGDTISEKVAVSATLNAEATITVTATDSFVPVYNYALGDLIAIEETRSFVEDIYSNFIIINLLNFTNHNLLQLEIEAKIRGLDEVHRGTLNETERVIDFDYILPLTTYLENFILDIRITKIFNDRPAELTPWIAWDLNNGPVSITPDLLTL